MNIRPGFWLRWSWRDLRSRWLQVVAVSIIIALGTGIYSGLSGQRTWRENSYDDSYALLNMYDLKVKLASGSFIDDAELQTMLAGIDGIDRAEGRLQTATLVDASEAAATEDSVLIPGVVVGVDLSEGGPRVNGFFIREDAPFDTGRNLTEADNGQLVATIPYLTASQYGIEPGSALHISGNVTLEVIGVTMTPEYFLIVNPDSNNIFSFGNFFPVFVPLETAQQISGREGLVNDFVLTLQPNIDPAAVQAVIEAGMESTFPDVGYTVEDREDNLIYTQLYQDAEGDQGTWTSLAILFLLGASFGVFNLAGRMVESQRRQIGIGMALGVPRRWIALRPMLVGVQIAVLGTFFGGLMGFLFSQGFGSIMDEFAPMPLFEITLYLRGFLVAVALGIILPVLATLIPVWRAVRVSPIDAIKTGHLVAKGGGLSGVLNRLPLPGDSFTQMPFRNILRAPWRTLLTVLGIALAILL
ncbi:MAG TPA: FtsX-like permease family protein, partial [Aggregatilineales bacterium]|nr:FtsX-like permease family protein [Aggregatilineales bacterium]